MPVWIDGGPRRRRMRRTLAIAMLPALAVGGAATVYTATQTASDTSLAVESSVTFTGQGNGHGRGMGQWGAFGYAKNGWKAEQIVAHYYGGSALARADVNLPVKVQLTKQNAVNVYAPAGAKVGDQVVAPGQAVRISNGNATITQGCGGAVVRSVAAADSTVSPIAPGANRPENEILRFCGSNVTYRGALAAQDGKVYNVVNVEDYLRSVVPVESHVDWADQGGMEALRAQAIAARSYALAEGAKRGERYNDTQDSQVYGGFAKEDQRTDQAVSSTAGLVMAKNGFAVPTEFSSSTGGYTSGGDFTAVRDDGDVVSPFRNWTVSVPTAKIGSAFGVGAFKSIRVTETQAATAPRATKVEVAGSARTVTVSGMDVREKLGLRSDWFVIEGQAPAGAAPVTTAPGAAPAVPGQAAPAAPTAPVAPTAPTAPVAPTAPATTPAPGTVVDRQIVAAPVDPFNPVPTAPNAAQAAPVGAPTPTVPTSAAATSAAAATPVVPTVAAVPAAPSAPAVPTVPGAAAAVPAAPAAPVIPGIPAPPTAAVAGAAGAAAPTAQTGTAAVEAAYAGAGGEAGSLGRIAANPVTFPDGSMFQPYQNGAIYYTPARGAQVVPSGVAAPATLMNWVMTFAAGGAPALPPLPMLNLIPGWGDLLGINPAGTGVAAAGVPAAPVPPGAPAAPSPAAPSPETSGAASPAPSSPAAPSPAAPAPGTAPSAAPAAAPAAPVTPTPLPVPTVPSAPA